MSFRITAWAVKQKVRNATCKAVLLVLADYADEHGVCFPKQTDIAAKTGASERSVRRALKTLRDDKLIADRRRGRGAGKGGCLGNLYTLQVVRGGLQVKLAGKGDLQANMAGNSDRFPDNVAGKSGGFPANLACNPSKKEEPITSKIPITQERARAPGSNMGERFAALSQALAAGMDAGLDRRARSFPASPPGTSANEIQPVEAVAVSEEIIESLKARLKLRGSPPAKTNGAAHP